MYINEEQLGDYLVNSGFLSKKKFSELVELADSKNKIIGDILITNGILTDDELRKSYSHILGMVFVDLVKKDIDYEILSLIPEPVARKNSIIAFNKNDDGALEVAVLDIDNLNSVEFIKKKTGLKIIPRITNEESIKYALKLYHKSLKEDLYKIINEDAKKLSDEDVDNRLSFEKMANRVPTVRVVDALLQHAIVQNASDVHIEPHEDGLIVRYRIDGILHDVMTLPVSASNAIAARIKVLANLKLDERRLPQDGRFKMEASGEKIALRVSILPTSYGEKIVMRLLKNGSGGFTLEGLGFGGVGLEQIHNAMRSRTGILLITGPTGSGKTTTLYSILDILNTPDVNISTVEDPVEYQLPRINQTQVNPDIGLTFANGLRSLMRQDPDIIMVGEIRDKETANLAVSAALTGHLVLSTLHTNSAAAAPARLIDLGVEPFLLTSTLRVIIGQRLVRKLCVRDSKEVYHLTGLEVREFDKHADMSKILKSLKSNNIISKAKKWGDVSFYKPKFLKDCDTGYSGRSVIAEVLTVDVAVKDMIIKGASGDDIEEHARKVGMFTMMEDGILKAGAGITSLEEVLRVISE